MSALQALDYDKVANNARQPTPGSEDDKAFSEDFIEKKSSSNDHGPTPDTARPVGYEPANEEERALDKRINRKLDWIVLPIMSVNYALAGLDKNSLGNALTVTFIEDTGFDPNTVQNAVSMTAVAIIFAPFLIALGRKFGVSVSSSPSGLSASL